MPQLSAKLLAQMDIAIANHHLDFVGDEIRKNSAECLALIAVEKDDYSSIGNSRFGGNPDLPEGVEWPTDPESKRPSYSNFIAQINFAELPCLHNDDVLPTSGILYVFVRSMECAALPVILDAIYYDGDPLRLSRRPTPPEDSLCDEYIVNLVPQRIISTPSISVADYRKSFRRYVNKNTQKVNGDDGVMRCHDMSSDFIQVGQIGQLLGFANANDDRENLYRQVVFGRLGRRALMYRDYWDTMEEYEAYIKEWTKEPQMVKEYQSMREDVMWLTSNGEMISNLVNEWRLLFRLDSNLEMDLNINDGDPLYVFIRHEDLANRDFSNLAGEVTQG